MIALDMVYQSDMKNFVTRMNIVKEKDNEIFKKFKNLFFISDNDYNELFKQFKEFVS